MLPFVRNHHCFILTRPINAQGIFANLPNNLAILRNIIGSTKECRILYEVNLGRSWCAQTAWRGNLRAP